MTRFCSVRIYAVWPSDLLVLAGAAIGSYLEATILRKHTLMRCALRRNFVSFLFF